MQGTLAMVSRAAKRSALVFDHITKHALEHPDASFEKQLVLAAKYGEPYLFGIDPEGVAALVERHGLRVEVNLSASDLGARYLVGRTGRRGGACARRWRSRRVRWADPQPTSPRSTSTGSTLDALHAGNTDANTPQSTAKPNPAT